MSGVVYMRVVAPSHVARALWDIRERRRYSLRDVARLTGISHSKLGRIELGAEMDARTLVALSAFIKRHRA